MELRIEKQTAKKIYAGAPDALKAILVETFGSDCFKTINFKDLKTFDDLCKACGTTEAEFEKKYRDMPVSSQLVRFARMEIMTTAINQGWVKDTLDTNQRKWYPYFTVSSSGLAFSGSCCDYGDALAVVGSCLCFESEEKSDYAGKQFLKLWEEFITGKNA